MRGAAEDIPRFIHTLSAADIPAEVFQMARRCLLDTLGVWAAGTATTPSRIARNHAALRYPGQLPLPFDGRRVNPVGFAFAGAATIDAIDGHDGHQMCKGHASVALLPALLAERYTQCDVSLDTALVDFIVGTEIALRAGLALHATAPDYHSSGAWNGLGCAVIAARVRGLSQAKTWQALGIAEYYGPRAQMMRCIDHPTMVKDSSAWGALVGLSAADLAEDGFTGAPAVTCDHADVTEIWADLGPTWRILETNFKAYPVCRWAQPAIEGVLALMRTHSLAAEDVAGITVATFAEAARLDARRPADGDAAQYSLPLAVALALIDGDVTPQSVLPERFDRPEVWHVVDRITLTEHTAYSQVFPAERYADVTLTLKDERRVKSARCAARGNFDDPLTDGELIAKFNTYAARDMSADKRARMINVLRAPDQAPDFAQVLEMLNDTSKRELSDA